MSGTPTFQKTIGASVNCSGVGVHSGKPATLTLHPAAPNTGIIFKRLDVASHQSLIPAKYDNVSQTRLCTTLSNEYGISISTIEHVMAALAGYGIDNVLITVDGPEVPIMDGSSISFVFLLECAGIISQPAAKSYVKVLKPITVQDENAQVTLEPSDEFVLNCDIEFSSPVIGEQSYSFQMLNGAFKSELARARTFGLLKDVEALRAAGLALGGSLDNAIVIDDSKVLNADGLRYNNEFVRHKTLDAIGDLALAGHQLLAEYTGFRPSHQLNNMVLRALFEDETAWCISTDVSATQGLSKQPFESSFEGLAYITQPA